MVSTSRSDIVSGNAEPVSAECAPLNTILAGLPRPQPGGRLIERTNPLAIVIGFDGGTPFTMVAVLALSPMN